MPRNYVDNARNRGLGRVGLPVGSAVHSRSSSGSGSFSSSSGTHRTYVDNAMNRNLGRVGMEHGTAVHSKSSSRSETSKTYADNSMKPQLARVDMEHGTAVHSKSGTTKTYVDNEVNRKLDRVGLEYGSEVNSRVVTPGEKVYVDNAFNRKHSRVGLPMGSAPVSRKNETYRDNALNRKLGRVGKPWGTHVVDKNMLAALRNHLKEYPDDEIPSELNDLPEDVASAVVDFTQREKAVEQFLEEAPHPNWQPHQHILTETIKRYKGAVINFEDLRLRQRIGQGGFGEVYFASLDGEAVAVKKLKFQVTKKRLQQFMNEMDLFLGLNHPHIVSFLGACTETPNLAIVMELMDMSLFDAIHIQKVDFTVDDKLEIMRGVTKGMAYLHYSEIAHCDLKTQNVLLINVPGEPLTDGSEPVLAKITDFGLSKMKSDMATSSSFPVANYGTPRYAAPEIHQGKILKLDQLKKADMYSLGLLIWELAVEEIPFEDLTYQQLKVQVGEKGLTPVESENLRLDKKLHESLSLCWSMDPDKRPSSKDMAEVASTLTTLFEEGEE